MNITCEYKLCFSSWLPIMSSSSVVLFSSINHSFIHSYYYTIIKPTLLCDCKDFNLH
jgi:hypothetical protein